MRECVRMKKLNDRGSALVMVIVVVTFISILATTMLYISGMNFQMKVTDYNTKISFYEAEVPLEELRTQLVEDASTASAEAYRDVMAEYMTLGTADVRAARFQELFYQNMRDIWTARKTNPLNPAEVKWSIAIKSVLSDKYDNCVQNMDTAISWQIDAATNTLRLCGFEVIYTDAKGYTSVIETDFSISPPLLSWDGNPVSSGSGGSSDLNDCVSYVNWEKR